MRNLFKKSKREREMEDFTNVAAAATETCREAYKARCAYQECPSEANREALAFKLELVVEVGETVQKVIGEGITLKDFIAGKEKAAGW